MSFATLYNDLSVNTPDKKLRRETPEIMEVEPNIYGEDTIDTRQLLRTTFAPMSTVLRVLIEKIGGVLEDKKEKCVLFTLPKVNKHCIEIFMYQMILDIKQENHVFPPSAYISGGSQENCPMGKDYKKCDACNKIVSRPDNQLVWLNKNMQSMLSDVSEADSFNHVPMYVCLFAAWQSICHLINADIYNKNYANAFKSIYTYTSNCADMPSMTHDKRKRGRPKKQDNVDIHSIPFVNSIGATQESMCNHQKIGAKPNLNETNSVNDEELDVTHEWTDEMFQGFDDMCEDFVNCIENSK
jgi:hypothetical protein